MVEEAVFILVEVLLEAEEQLACVPPNLAHKRPGLQAAFLGSRERVRGVADTPRMSAGPLCPYRTRAFEMPRGEQLTHAPVSELYGGGRPSVGAYPRAEVTEATDLF